MAALLFAGQAGGVLLMGERARLSRHPVAPPMLLRLLDAPLDQEKWSRNMFSPAIPLFSHRPLRTGLPIKPGGCCAPMTTRLPCWNRRRLFWNLPPQDPARASSRRRRMLLQTPFPWASQSGLAPESVPASPAAETSRPESFLRIEGPLADRKLDLPAVLPSWTNSFLVNNSVVQFAVNRSGQVISAVLLAGSGLKEADDSALAAVQSPAFSPGGWKRPRIGLGHGDPLLENHPAALKAILNDEA